MPQQDSGPDARQETTISLNGSGPADPTAPGNFGAPPGPRVVGSGPASGPAGNGQRPPAKPGPTSLPLETALTRMGGHHTPWQDSKGVSNSNTMEYFRRIYLSLQTPTSPDTLPTIGVTSALDGEGKSTIALGIATAMAADLDSPIVLVELNLTRPTVHKSLGLPAQPGLSEYLRGECPLPQALRQVTENLFVLPAGDCRNDAARLIRMLTRANLLLRMDNSGAVLVLDLPPVLTASYGVLASSMADAVVLVVRAGHTPENKVKDAIARLDESTLRGIVLNAARPSIPTWLGGYL
jgi:Mrp family chromosome partitioning ATPase